MACVLAGRPCSSPGVGTGPRLAGIVNAYPVLAMAHGLP